MTERPKSITPLDAFQLLRNAAGAGMHSMMESSFKDFHARGLDYVCLKRTPEYTVKAYILDGDASQVPEVVNPHDHRYAFRTHVISGSMIDFRYLKVDEGGMVYNAFDYHTPLNGGNGFTFRGEERLAAAGSMAMLRSAYLDTEANHLHTIRMMADQTILILEQFADELPIEAPTSCWVRKGYPEPDTSGLYSKFTEEEFMIRLRTIADAVHKCFGG